MNAFLPEPGSDSQSPKPRQRTLVRRWRIVLAATLALGLVVALGVLAWEWRHPHAFRDAEGGISQSTNSWPVGKAIYVGVTYGQESGWITIHDAEPVVERNSARAEIEYFVCTPERIGGGVIFSVDAAGADRHCGTLERIAGKPIEFELSGNRQILMRVTPTTEGVVRVSSSDLFYSQGWREGRQRVGDGIRIRAVRRTEGGGDCNSHYEPVASAPTWGGLKDAMLDYQERGRVASVRTQARGHDVGAGDQEAVRVVDLLNRNGRRLAQADVWRTDAGVWRAGVWGQCID